MKKLLILASITEGDKGLKTFNIDHDRQFRIPFIKQAIAAAGGTLTMYVSPWSPPAFMKTNNSLLQGGLCGIGFLGGYEKRVVIDTPQYFPIILTMRQIVPVPRAEMDGLACL